MVNWRELLVVEDSDDDADASSIGSVNSVDSVAHHALPLQEPSHSPELAEYTNQVNHSQTLRIECFSTLETTKSSIRGLETSTHAEIGPQKKIRDIFDVPSSEPDDNSQDIGAANEELSRGSSGLNNELVKSEGIIHCSPSLTSGQVYISHQQAELPGAPAVSSWQNESSPLAERQEEPKKDFIVEDKTSSQTSRPLDVTWSRDSSPLSSPPTSPELPPHGFNVDDRRELNASEPLHQDLIHTPQFELSGVARVSTRQFRERAPIQQHPYQIDYNRHVQQFGSAGLRPEKIGGLPSKVGKPTGPPDEISQEVDSEPFLCTPPSSPGLPSSPLLAAAPPALVIRHDDDSLPDIGALLQPNAKHVIGTSLKRRKIQHELRAENNNTIQRQGTDALFSDGVAVVIPENHGVNSSAVNVHGSLSVSRPHRLQRPRFKKFRVPRGISPLQLPTPDRSSETGNPVFHIMNIDNETESELDEVEEVSRREQEPRLGSASSTPREASPVLLSDRDDNLSDDEEVDQIQSARKKFRGVLPASYIRLDKQLAKRPTASKKFNGARGSKGQAVRRPPRLQTLQPTINTPNSRTLFDAELDNVMILNGEESDTVFPTDFTQSPPSSTARTPLARLEFHLPDDDEYSMEDNWIDPMLPSATRAVRETKGSSKRQHKLPDVFFKHGTKQSRDRKRSSRLSTLETKPTKQRIRRDLHHRSVVDATIHLQSAPDFLRLAVRQAKRQPDAGRHAAEGKVILMPSRQDGLEVDEVLHDWRKGRVKKSSHTVSMPRSSVNQSSLNFPLNLSVGTGTPSNAAMTRFPYAARGRQASNRLPINVQSMHPHQLHQRRARTPSKSQFKPSVDTVALSAPRTTDGQLARASTTAQRMPGRTGQLEDLEVGYRDSLKNKESSKPIARLWPRLRSHHDMLSGNHKSSAVANTTMLERYLESNDDDNTEQNRSAALVQPPTSLFISSPRKQKGRKRHPKHIELSSIKPHEIEHSPSRAATPVVPVQEVDRSVNRVQFSETMITFDASLNPMQLPTGAYFQRDTFIGSSEFHEALKLGKRDMHDPRPTVNLNLLLHNVECGPWNLEVGSSLMLTLRNLSDSNNHAGVEMAALIRSVIRYFAKTLYFLDPVDRQHCVLVSSEFSTMLFSIITQSPQHGQQYHLVKSLSYLTVLIDEIRQLSKCLANANVYLDVLKHEKEVLESLMSAVGDVCATNQSTDLCQSNHELLSHTGVPETSVIAEAVVIANHLSMSVEDQQVNIWTFLNIGLLRQFASTPFEGKLETMWRIMFEVMPFLSFDTTGIQTRGSVIPENWIFVRALVGKTLELFSTTEGSRPPNINAYVRLTLQRCHHLMTISSWRRCESLLGIVFDFFARRGFSNLPREDSRGTPAFLEDLSAKTNVSVIAGDSSFDIFLKLLFTGLRNMRAVYTEKKISNIAWRFIPNHGRGTKKEDELKQEDFEALRNQHNLLCVLYAGCPFSHRPSVQLLRDLVDYDTSHAEVCRLNVRAWANLTRYHVSIEGQSDVGSLVDWVNDIVRKSTVQHRMARIEAEAINSKMVHPVDRGLLESTIAGNQRQVETVLSTVLSAMNHLLNVAKNSSTVKELFSTSSISEIFDLFDPKSARVNSVVEQALDVYRGYTAYVQHLILLQSGASTNDDSQDYGDWPSDDDVVDVDEHGLSNQPSSTALVNALMPLLSNAFGADRFHQDKFLLKLVDAWVATAKLSVLEKQHDWSLYLDKHSASSWSHLRATDQTRLFRPYYFARIVESDKSVFKKHKNVFLTEWLVSLAERESMLKYQNTLTSVLLNLNSQDPVLHNLPFARDTQQQYCITLAELRERRLSLISCVLANMRESYETAQDDSRRDAQKIRQKYAELLGKFMTTMRHNFEELHDGSSLRGNYVGFVQQVVELLQQFATEICPVDKFFVDSTAFPLPHNDPTYVVGRLKSYGLRAGDLGAQKKLAIFMQTVIERASIDRQQRYLVEQLGRTMGCSFDEGRQTSSSLRKLLLEGIFPAYLELAFHETGSVLARPILEATELAYKSYFFGIPLHDPDALAASLSTTTTVLQSLQKARSSFRIDTEWTAYAPAMVMLTAWFQTATAILSPLDYMVRMLPDGIGRPASAQVRGMLTWSGHVLDRLDGLGSGGNSDNHHSTATAPPTPPAHPIRAFCAGELRSLLNGSWTQQGGKVYRSQGSACREIVVGHGPLTEQRMRLREAIRQLQETYERLSLFGNGCSADRGGTGVGESRPMVEAGDADFVLV